MPVNTAALKTFAPEMRRQLLEAVGRKLDLLLNSQTPDTLSTYAKQIAELREQEAENREQLLERVAYTWFNRLCALRYLDARGWHPFGCKVLMPAAEGETQPELLKLMRAGSLPAELKPHTNEARLHGLLDGQIPPALAGADPQGEVYRDLVQASCRSYHQLLPELFEGLDDASELLLPDDLISEGSIAGGFRNAISDEDCKDVEIIGWLYQFYISEKKDQVMGKVVKSEDIPAATQIFTPNWIVKYLLQNSLGARWLAAYPDSAIREQMEYYVEPTEKIDKAIVQPGVITQDSLNPEELTLIDPACGSGHILVEAYDLFKVIYLEQGYQQREIPRLILQKNLFGLDIDERAAQLTIFALMMKGRADDRRLFERPIRLNVKAVVNSTGLDSDGLENALDFSDYGLKSSDCRELKQLFEHATTLGSLIQVPERLAEKIPALKRLNVATSQDICVLEALQHLKPQVEQAEMLATKYDVVVMNPPYMGIKGMNSLVKTYAKDNYSEAKSDLFACFIERGSGLVKDGGYHALVTMQSWMFLSSFEKMRERILREKAITTMAHFGPGGFDHASAMVVQTVAFVLRNCAPSKDSRPVFFRLVTGGEREKAAALRARLGRFDAVRQDAFKAIPGCPLAYSASPSMLSAFTDSRLLGEDADPRQGLTTSDNAKFVRMWFEVSPDRCNFTCFSSIDAQESGKRWFPYNKGGTFRRWSGNLGELVDWEDDGSRIKELVCQKYPYLNGNPDFVTKNRAYYFKSGVTWSKVGSGRLAARIQPAGVIFSDAGECIFPEANQPGYCALLNSNVAQSFIELLAPTLNLKSSDIARLPVPSSAAIADAERLGILLTGYSQADWNAYECSWDFQSLPVLALSSNPAPTLEANYRAWVTQNCNAIAEMKRLEEENNLLFIEAYGLQGELIPDVSIEQITLTVNPAYRYGGNLSEDEQWTRFQRDTLLELLSYAVGCMMGRYSLDEPGLILAVPRGSQPDQLAAYEEKVGKPLTEIQFKPDPDGIIPVLDGEWFEDDIVARTREFLAVTFPESSVAENLRFIEESLGKDIRKYFCSEFYKDHLQTYKKRPIYWMVQSPKKGFACLIYLHRYTKDTLNQVLNNYFRPYLQKLEARLAQLGLDQLNDDLPARERTAARKEAEKITKVLKECQVWEQGDLLPLAQQRIELDLDDGVKVNYLKLQDVLAPIPGLAAKETED